MQPVPFIWRVLRDGQPTALLLHLEDDKDGETAALVIAAARAHGVELEPVYPADVELATVPPLS